MNIITLRSFDNYFIASITLTKLQDAGVECFLKDEHTVTIDPILSNAIGGIKLVVNEEHAEEAKKILQQFDEEYLQSVKCPQCGAAAITLNRCREEAGIRLADPIQTEIDQFAGVAYQIRNAFAHDIAEPRWKITNPRFARSYEFGGIRVDLSNVGTKRFEYQDIGGPDVLFCMKSYGESTAWA